MTDSVNIRELVLDMLLQITRDGEKSHIVIKNVLDKYQYLSRQERAFLKRAAQGTLERMIELDYILNQYSTVRTNKMKPVIRNILRSAVYQICYMDGIPDSAVCNEAVKLAAKRGFRNLKGFVNGVLRNVARNKHAISYPERQKDLPVFLSVGYSMPEWIVQQFLADYGETITEAILQDFLAIKGTTIRCNLNKNTPEELIDLLQQEQVEVSPCQGLGYAFEIKGYDALHKLQAFQDGRFIVQDTSSMLVAETAVGSTSAAGDEAECEGGVYCLDICAAPGGKALHMAEKLVGRGKVTARDISEYKTALIDENAERMQITNIRTEVWNALEPDEKLNGKADIVLADVPCSGLGVLHKKPDIKYQMTAQQQDELVRLQRSILERAAAYVKPGGTFVYSTCTINKKENEENARWFAEQFPFTPVSLNEVIPEVFQTGITEEGYLQLLPGVHPCDGFFIAKFRRDGESIT